MFQAELVSKPYSTMENKVSFKLRGDRYGHDLKDYIVVLNSYFQSQLYSNCIE